MFPLSMKLPWYTITYYNKQQILDELTLSATRTSKIVCKKEHAKGEVVVQGRHSRRHQMSRQVWKRFFRLGEERCTIAQAHLDTLLKLILGAFIVHHGHHYSAPNFGVKIFLNNSYRFLIRRSNYLLLLWRFCKTLSKHVTRRVDYFVFKLITNYYQTINSKKNFRIVD